MNPDVFISYKSDEEQYAYRVRKVLEDNGISCWMAPDSIPLGSNYMAEIPKAIEACRAVIILVSKKSQQSVWVKNEFSQAVTKNKLIIPYVIQDCPMENDFAFSMSTMQQVFAWKDEEAALQRLVEDLRNQLGKDGNAKIEISVVRKHTLDPKLLIAAVVVVALAVTGIFLFRKKPADTPSAEIYYSEVLPYTMAGWYATPQDAQDNAFDMPVYGKAFSLLSFIRNTSDKPVFAEKIACKINALEAIDTPYIDSDGVMIDDTLYGFAYNDGWGDAEEVHAEWYVYPDPGVPEFRSFMDSLQGTAAFSLESGMAHKVFEQKADFSELLAWAREEKLQYATTLYTLRMDLTYGEQEDIMAMFLMYDPDKDAIIATFGGYSVDQPSITLFGFLDVDAHPSEIRFTSNEAFPVIDDIFRIETVIIPTKSCTLTCAGEYSIDGISYQTEDYTLQVTVPVFEELSMTASGAMTRELAETNTDDPRQIRKICDQYRYRIESVIPAEG